MSRFCSQCGAQNRDDARFCTRCATPFTSGLGQPEPPGSQASAEPPPYQPGMQVQAAYQHPTYQPAYPPQPGWAPGRVAKSKSAAGLLGIVTFGCGMTRAISSLLHAEAASALAYNRLVVVVFPLLCAFLLKDLISILQTKTRSRHDKNAAEVELSHDSRVDYIELEKRTRLTAV